MTSSQPLADSQTKRGGTFSAIYWILSLSIFGGAVASILVGTMHSDEEVKQVFQTAVTPILTLFAGGVINDLYHRLGEDQQLTGDVRKSTDATLIMLLNVRSIETWLRKAANDLNDDDTNQANTSVQVALTMTTGTLTQVRQNLRLWKSLSPKAFEQARNDFDRDEVETPIPPVEPPVRQEIVLSADSAETGEKNG